MKYDILFLDGERSFIKMDLNILKRHFKVIPFRFNVLNIFSLIRAFNLVRKSKVIYCWFGSINTAFLVFFAKCLRKKSVVVAGGVDVESLPKYNYGDMNTKLYKYIPKYCFANSDVTIAVSEFTAREAKKHTAAKNIIKVFNCVNTKNFFPSKTDKKESVLTVATNQKDVVLKKGLDSFVSCAKRLPAVKFIMIGLPDEIIGKFSQYRVKNLELRGEVSHSEILKYFQKAKVYCQLSLIESFGVALAESMLCECVPVVTKNAALPEVVGRTGFYCDYGDIDSSVAAICNALISNKGKSARERIIKVFSVQQREKNIVSVVEGLIRN